MAKQENKVFLGTGRRKKSIARVRLMAGTGKITVNGKDITEYFWTETLIVIAKQALVAVNKTENYDVIVKVIGGGFSGQAGAIRHGIARALVEADEEEYRPTLKAAGYLTRDSRMKERKKYGLKKARKAPQFSKRYIIILIISKIPLRRIIFLEVFFVREDIKSIKKNKFT